MKCSNRYICILLAAALCLALSGCASTDMPVLSATQLQAAAETALAAGEYRAAADYCTQWAALEPANTQAYRCLAAVYEQSGEQQALSAVYETLFKMDAFTQADYLRLAELYEAAGDSQKQRKILEYGMLLSPSDVYAPLLNALVVNVSGASQPNDAFAALFGELHSGDSYAAFLRLCSKEWQNAVAPLVPGLDAKYRYEDSTGIMRALCSVAGDQLVSHVWLEENGQVIYLSAANGRLIAAKAQAASGVYTGSFEAAYCDLSAKVYFSLAGTLNNGLCSGEYSFNVSWENDGADTAPALWQQATRAELTHYSGRFENGAAMVKQQGSVENGVVYAYTENKKEFLYAPLSEGEPADEYVFNAACFGFTEQPAW